MAGVLNDVSRSELTKDFTPSGVRMQQKLRAPMNAPNGLLQANLIIYGEQKTLPVLQAEFDVVIQNNREPADDWFTICMQFVGW